VRPHLATLVADFRRYGEQIAVVTYRGNRRFSSTYAQLGELSARCAHAFDQAGLKPGDRILLWGNNSVEWMAAFFGCILRGIVAVPLDAAGSLEFAAESFVLGLGECEIRLMMETEFLPMRHTFRPIPSRSGGRADHHALERADH